MIAKLALIDQFLNNIKAYITTNVSKQGLSFFFFFFFHEWDGQLN
jgi:hypothetical protein